MIPTLTPTSFGAVISGGGDLMKIHIQFQNQFFQWRHYTTKNNQRDAYRTAANRAAATGKRHRLVDDQGNLLDLVNP